ncbi:GFA family protein [Pararhodobacter sp. CCB-MM2]|uniref:GFA family protein n=1 Tax=Pararhodobacter sp. CCB-MM2 TaxID=1786003 RepID=UPI000834B343|nr:GFA family protein [Pararhodobacter sp. CCB-MM2]
MSSHEGGCLCGRLRFRTTVDPLWVTVCLCHYCQRATGAQGMVQPVFNLADFEITKGTPKVYSQVSEGSGHEVHAHFCEHCGTKTHLTFARWPDKMGVYAGTYDDPSWFDLSPANGKYIFADSAARGTLVPAGFRVFAQAAATNEGVALEPRVLDEVLHLR